MRIHEQAVKYLKHKDGESEPFFCCVSYHHPHNPFYAPEEVRQRFVDLDYELPEMPEDLDYGVMERWLNDFHGVPGLREYFMKEENLRWLYETYLAMVYDVDMHAGELIRVLEEKGILEDTVIIFASDHGDMMGHRGMVQKRSFYDRSAKVPLIFSFPGNFCEGKHIVEPVSLLDLFPTLADMAGGKAPSDLPGISLHEALISGSGIPDRPVFCEYHGEGVHAPCFMVREGKYKYIYVHGYEELIYNLSKDPEEMHNHIGDPKLSHIVSRLKGRILDEFDPNDVSKNALISQRNRKYIYDCVGKAKKEDNPF
jgi:choline-sulfatase